MTRPVQDPASQAAYKANKKSINVKENLDIPNRSFKEIKEMVESKFSAQDKAEIKKVGSTLKKYGVSIQRSNLNAESMNVAVTQSKSQKQGASI